MIRLKAFPPKSAASIVRHASTQTPSDAGTKNPPPPPPVLNRPIGFPSPLTRLEPLPSLMQRAKSLLTTPGQHKQILAEEGGSYWSDFHAMRVNEGKQWLAPAQLFKAEKSLFFPNLGGRTLAREDADVMSVIGEPTLVRVFSATSGEEHVHALGDDLGIQVVDINIQTNTLKYALLRLFLGRIKALIDPARHDRYFILGNGYERKLKMIGVINAYVGYSYLLDKEGRIRWASSGRLTEEERASLARVTQRLIELKQ